MRYKLAVFDMDGTILNTLEDLADSTNYALKANGLPERTIDEVRRFVGNGIRLLIERLFRQIPSRNLLMKFLKHSKTIIKHIVP